MTKTTWLKKISQRNKQEILDQVWGYYKQQDAEIKSLRQQLGIQPAKSYYESVISDYQIDILRHQQYQQRLSFLSSLLPEVQQTNDTVFIQNFQKEIAGLQETLTTDAPVQPVQSDFDNYLDEEVLEFYADIDQDVNQHIIPLLDRNNAYYDFVDFPTGKQIFVTEISGQLYVIEQYNNKLSLQEAEEWIESSEERFHEFYDIDQNDQFWNEVGPGSFVYHATQEEYASNIMKQGLVMDSQTRGLSNRYTPSAVFASENPDSIDAYGSTVFAIDLGQMKQDGYMPQIEREEPIQEKEMKETLAHAIGLDDYQSEADSDIAGDTVVIFGNIPPKYLKRIS